MSLNLSISDINDLLGQTKLKYCVVDIPSDSQNSICDFCVLRDLLVEHSIVDRFEFNTGLCNKCPMVSVCWEIPEPIGEKYIVLTGTGPFSDNVIEQIILIAELVCSEIIEE